MIYIAIALILVVLFGVFCYFQNNTIDKTEYIILSKNIRGAVTLVQLSDMHSKPFKKVLTELDDIKPDIIAITGDYINDKCKNKEKMFEFGKELLKRAPVFYITGNHERRLDNFEELMNL